jgi:hypothetical protein
VQLSSVHDGMCMHAVTKERGEHGRRGKKRGETSFVLFGSMLVEKLEGGGGVSGMFVFLHIDTMILMEAAAFCITITHTPMHHADAAIAGQQAGLPGTLGLGGGWAGKGAIEKCMQLQLHCIACTALLESGSLPSPCLASFALHLHPSLESG